MSCNCDSKKQTCLAVGGSIFLATLATTIYNLRRRQELTKKPSSCTKCGTQCCCGTSCTCGEACNCGTKKSSCCSSTPAPTPSPVSTPAPTPTPTPAPTERDFDNRAFVFIKPHANTSETQKLVSEGFQAAGIRILQEGELTGEQIAEGRLIDQHYYAIASKATLKKPSELPVPAEKFQAKFGLSWEEALASGKVFNALDACEYLGIDSNQLDAAWAQCKKQETTKLVKFGGGFYCGLVDSIEGKDLVYVFNGFFMSMREKYVAAGSSIHFYVVSFPSATLSWSDFRGRILGATDPSTAPATSLRGQILANWQSLGLSSQPNTGDNGVHASASPFEGLAERMNWLKVPVEQDPFGQQLLAAGLTPQTISEWTLDPQVKGAGVFDSFEDKDASEVVALAKEMNA